MSRLLRSLSSEYRKVTATKMWWILALVLAAYSALMAAVFAWIFGIAMEEVTGGSPVDPAHAAAMVYATPATFGYVIPLLLGTILATGELRHRTLGLAFIAEPKRGIVLTAKTLVLLLFGAIVALLGTAAALAAGAALLSQGGGPGLDDTSVWAVIARVIVALAVWAVIGFGLGLLVRNQAISIVIALVFTQFLEPMLRTAAMFWEPGASIGRFLPGAATDAFVGASVMSDMASLDASVPSGQVEPLGIWGGLAVLVAYAVVAVVLGWVLRWRRDVEH